MRRTCLLLTVAAFAAGCTAPMEISRFVDFPDSKELQECTGPATGPALKITYGDSKIIVDHILKVSKNDIIKIDLHPANNSEEGVDYKNLEIMLVGKSGNSQ